MTSTQKARIAQLKITAAASPAIALAAPQPPVRVQILTGKSDYYERWSNQTLCVIDANQAYFDSNEGRKIDFLMTCGHRARRSQAPGTKMKTLDDTYLPRGVHAQPYNDVKLLHMRDYERYANFLPKFLAPASCQDRCEDDRIELCDRLNRRFPSALIGWPKDSSKDVVARYQALDHGVARYDGRFLSRSSMRIPVLGVVLSL
ncbi:hypothetical protein BFW01_g12316 [Lasiodiplodia theobromae]|nr:hypothetical protein BFW01_g12316 [Lasiodiplodia theobromae]